MTDSLDKQINDFVASSGRTSPLRSIRSGDQIEVIKYMPADRLALTIKRHQFYASERAGFTWGDAVYAAPLSKPFTTMMYGHVGVVGEFDATHGRFFDATDPDGISLYQRWIQLQTQSYRDLTTTLHAAAANQDLRNAFRTRFRIDCVYFRPDETCPIYVKETDDLWLAITHWDEFGAVGHGYTKVISKLRWCVVSPDVFGTDGRGHKAVLHDSITSDYSFVYGTYDSLETAIRQAYASRQKQVVICGFK